MSQRLMAFPWFNTARPGCANTGHDFWPEIRTDTYRRALIEYLTL
jgi:hypothetical protein